MVSVGEPQDRHRPSGPGQAEAAQACQISGCQVLLTKSYDKKCRTCVAHRRARYVVISGQDARFCQKCGCFQPLAEFDGEKRSCQVRLDEHNKRQRRLRALRLKDKDGEGAEAKGDQECNSVASGSTEGMALQAPEAVAQEDGDFFATLVEPVLDTLSMDELLDLRTVAAVQASLQGARQGVPAPLVPPGFSLEDDSEALVWLGSGSDDPRDEVRSGEAFADTATNQQRLP